MKQSREVEKILAELNYLEQKYGRALSDDDPNYDVPGEARARIQLLKDELAELGVRVNWDGSQYRVL